MSHPYPPLLQDKKDYPPSPTDTHERKKRAASPRSTPPRTKPRPQSLEVETSHTGIPSPPVSSASEEYPITRAPDAHPLEAFRSDWIRTIAPVHPNRFHGISLLYELWGVRITPSSRYSYRGFLDPRSPIALDRFTQIDLHALEYETCTILTDQRAPRPHPPPPLRDSHDLRTAVLHGQAVAFTAPSSSKEGIRSAPLEVPGYTVLHHKKTVFAGQGTFCCLSTTSHLNEAVLTQTVGQCVLVHFPMTPENRASAMEYSRSAGDLHTRFWWALAQPGVCVRLLLPGEHAFLPSRQMCSLICLGYDGSAYSATALSHVAPLATTNRQSLDLSHAH
ncbi:hypothetical protein AURDEDRAFT_173204 [Auricularia subglabra TFB-10046 SS5]|uniref:Uncharacterized protein n=1 Tax=Auricularia subglabra (strain TFB-10046 / SS5) TaxID=717982 RepID=J0LHR8_AURST|nr:hypothetical protein AURDEDRAFT_173204 [Auricularia subglabra TFB-10046 SS5]